MTRVEAAREKYRPESTRFLLVAEAPPKEESGRFFYFENVTTGDSLFLETMKVLYPQSTIDVKIVRASKESFLSRFKNDGFFLLDSLDRPISAVNTSGKKMEIQNGLPILIEKLMRPEFKDSSIILVSSTVYDVCRAPLIKSGIRVANQRMIDFPGSGGQVKFREKFKATLLAEGWTPQV